MHAGSGKMLGGNSAFAHIGRYEKTGDGVDIVIKTVRHNPDPSYRAMAGTDDATLIAKGRADGDLYRFRGELKELPGVPFQSVMTPITEDEVPIAGGVGEAGIADGLYSIHLRMLDGLDGGLTGVMLTREGLDEMIGEGRVIGDGAADLARSYVGIAVRAGQAHPEIATEAALRQTVLAARSIAYSRLGASGIYFAQLIERMGIAAA